MNNLLQEENPAHFQPIANLEPSYIALDDKDVTKFYNNNEQ